ncbi:MAG: peptidyl-alpha-hydroxyglycine alpha-amidating lyase family protein [Bryobacteraceae bacterium]
MKTSLRFLRLLLSCLPGVLLCQPGDLGYRLVPDWPTPARSAAGTPAGLWNLIQVPGVAVDAKGHVLVLHRGAHPILEFESTGKFVRSWGDGLFSEGKVVAIAAADRKPGASGYSAVYGPAGCDSCGAHSVRVDPEGNIWAVDAPGQVIYKMNPEGKVILRLGQRGVAGIGPNNFNLPTDVAFASNGDIYVTDGYGNPRVVKYTRDGKYLLQWGTRGNGLGQFQLPHNVAVDKEGKVYVTDRDNRRLEVFDSNGKFLQEWPDIGGVSAIRITSDQRIWTGGVLRDLQGKVQGTLPSEVGGAGGAHGIAVSESGDVYIGQLSGVVQKFAKK